MSASPVSQPGGNPAAARQTASEPAGVQSHASEAARFYQRGVAAARAGQKRVAAGYLTRSVQLDPRNEGAWLWLSGVVDDPHQRAFCLESVLKINPSNERAQRGLRWLKERDLLQGTAPDMNLPAVEVTAEDEKPRQRSSVQRSEHDDWWVSWRQWRRESSRVRLMWWAMPIIVLLLALAIHRSFALAVEESHQMPFIPNMDTVPPVAMAPRAADESTANDGGTASLIVPILEEETLSVRESRTIAYLDQLTPLRQQLRDAVNTYRDATGRPGGSMNHAAAARELYAAVEEGYHTMKSLTPPPELREAHDEYLLGLEEELAAISDLLGFHSSYRIELANRAVVRFQTANTHFDRARSLFDARLEQMEHESNVSVHTIR